MSAAIPVLSATPRSAPRPQAVFRTRGLGIMGVRAVLLSLVTAGIIFRFAGLGWGIPLAVPPEATGLRNSYHLDEDNYLWAAARVHGRNIDVGDYHWGTLQFYLIAGALEAGTVMGFLSRPWQDSFLNWKADEFSRIYATGRLVSSIAGILSLFMIFQIGKRLSNAEAGLMAAAFLAVSPFHVVHSHFLTADVTMVFLLLASIFFLLSSLEHDTLKARVAGGLTLGLSIAAKYNAACLLPLWIGSDLLRGRTRWRNSAAGCVAVLAGFALGEPYLLLHPSKITTVWDRLIHTEAASRLLYPWPHLLLQQAKALGEYGMGWTLAIPAAIGVLLWLVRPTPKKLALTASMALMIAFVVAARWPMLRYTLPLVPLAALAAAVFIADLPIRGLIRVAVVLVLAAPPLVVSWAQIQVLLREHPANAASRWIGLDIPGGSRIGQLWPELPPLDKQRFDARTLHGLFAGDPPAAADLDRQFLIVDNLPIQPFTQEFQDRLARDYFLLREFRSEPHIGPWVLDESGAPHDWKYTHPVVRIYGRKSFANILDNANRADGSLSAQTRPIRSRPTGVLQLSIQIPISWSSR